MNKLVARLCAFGLVLGLGLGLPARPAPAVPDIADFSLGITREETLLRQSVRSGRFRRQNLGGDLPPPQR